MLTFVWKNKQARIAEGGEEEGLGVGITTPCRLLLETVG